MINLPVFFDHIRPGLFHGSLNDGQVQGSSALLAAWEADAPGASMPFIAYALATAFHETAATMQPIAEYGHGAHRAYGAPAGPWHQAYYGRGDVQLTWEANYAHASDRLSARGLLKSGEDLREKPDLALRPDIAAAILIFGMEEGWFTGKRLADYFHGATEDPVGARRIINGTDKPN